MKIDKNVYHSERFHIIDVLVYKQYRLRKASVQQKRAEVQAAKGVEKEKKEVRERVRKEACTADIVRYGGLWQLVDEVDERLAAMDDRRKRAALESQLKFRHFVLCSKNKNNILSLSCNGKKHSVDRLTSNLKLSIRLGFDESQEVNNTGNPELVPLTNEVLLAEKRKFQELMEKEQQPRKKRKATHVPRAADVPAVEDPEDLVGKRVEHLWQTGDGEEWYKALVTGISWSEGRRGKTTYKFKIR